MFLCPWRSLPRLLPSFPTRRSSELAARAREARSRQLVLPPGAPRDALLRERAAAAEGPPPHAHRRAEIHDRLGVLIDPVVRGGRSEEHTSELQSLRHLVCRLLLEKK